MAVIKSFKGWHYNFSKYSNLEELIVPPYDVISQKELDGFKNSSPVNFSHIILNDGEKKHQKAAEKFTKWKNESVFVQSPSPSIYFYQQSFSLKAGETFCQPLAKGSETITRQGFFSLVQVEDYSKKVIFPHEQTFSGPKADRYELMKAAQGNMESVFLGYNSSRFTGDEFDQATASSETLCEYKDKYGVHHRLWEVTSEDFLNQMESHFKNQKLYILDGHHRYETALKFFKDNQRPETQFLLANICSFSQPGCIILPTHRAIRGLDVNDPVLVKKILEKYFRIEACNNSESLEEKLKGASFGAFGMTLANDSNLYFIEALSEVKSEFSGQLDLHLLHRFILERVLAQFTKTTTSNSEKQVLGGDWHDEALGGFDVGYIKNSQDLISQVNKSEYQIGFLVRPTRSQEIIDLAAAGKFMPHKSTYFYPKIPSGLLVNLF